MFNHIAILQACAPLALGGCFYERAAREFEQIAANLRASNDREKSPLAVSLETLAKEILQTA